MMKASFTGPFIFSLLIFLNSCSLIEPSSPVASYLRIDSISFKTDYATQGSNSKKITDAWVLVDNKYLGTFPLPTIVPILGEGIHKIVVKGGIIQNGISDSRAAYPKYNSFDTTFSMVAKDTFTIKPVVSYVDGLIFAQQEDFDDASLSLVTTNSNYAALSIIPQADPNSFERNSGAATLDAGHPVFEVASASGFPLPLNIPAYVELNYKCDVDLTIGVFISTTNGIRKNDLISLRSSSAWKKAYVSFSELGGVATDGIDYKIYLHAELGTLNKANLYLDNLKVVF